MFVRQIEDACSGLVHVLVFFLGCIFVISLAPLKGSVHVPPRQSEKNDAVGRCWSNLNVALCHPNFESLESAGR